MSEPEEESSRIAGHAGIVALGTLSSRVLGLVRDQVMAAVFTRAVTDAFFVAFTLPNVLRQLLAEGAVQSAVLPVLTGVREREGDAAAKRLFAALRGLSWTVLVTVTALGVAFAPTLVDLFAVGYHDIEGQFERTVNLTRWVFPYLFFMGTAALGVAALNTHRRFVATAFAPALLNVAFVAFSLWLPNRLGARGYDTSLALAAAALTGGALQVVAQWPSLVKIGYWVRPVFSLSHPGVREVLRRMGPTLLGMGVYYLDVLLARRFLSTEGLGAQSYFSWALRLCDFPQGIFVMALQTAALPSLSRLVARGDGEGLARTFAFGMRLSLFVALPATALAVALAEPVVGLLFQRGEFDAVSTHETARALIAQGSGIWLVASVRQLLSVYYALGDTRTPVAVAALDLLAFVVFALILREQLGHVGISVAMTLASGVQACLLAIRLGPRLERAVLPEILTSAARVALAAALAAAAARLALGATDLALVWRAALSLGAGGVAFFTVAWMLRCPELLILTRRGGQKPRSGDG